MITRGLLILAIFLTCGCKPYRIEYHRRPAYYDRLTDEPLPDRVEFPDGTVALYSSEFFPGGSVRDPMSKVATRDGEGSSFRIREERDDGTVVLRAFLPEHVIAHTLSCLRTQEYELFWDQMLSEETKRAYADAGGGLDEFSAHFRKHRRELARMFNRMRLGLSTHETVIEDTGDGKVECRFWPQVAELFEFKRVILVREDYGLKLSMIE